mmetsp:Transcript_28950/g.53448  ORF Transcript_28950/g.53448 Transcript_28950/m.53448 type:complete len:146 (-) Transcript_28950:18-455(-)
MSALNEVLPAAGSDVSNNNIRTEAELEAMRSALASALRLGIAGNGGDATSSSAPCCEIRAISATNIGVFATRFIRAREMILRDTPLIGAFDASSFPEIDPDSPSCVLTKESDLSSMRQLLIEMDHHSDANDENEREGADAYSPAH